MAKPAASTALPIQYDDLHLFIGGEWIGPGNRDTSPVINPSTGQVIGRIPHATIQGLNRALDVAERSFAIWSKMPAYGRAKVLKRTAELIRERARHIERLMTTEEGKAQDVRQRLVIVAVLILPVQITIPGFTVRTGSAVLTDGVTAPAFTAHIKRFRFRLHVLSPHETALDADSAVMVEDDKGSATRDVGGVVGLTLGLKPLDLGFKIAEARIDFIRQFLGALMLH